jgi:hypothetical protein
MMDEMIRLRIAQTLFGDDASRNGDANQAMVARD